MIAAAAVIKNPLAGRGFVENLGPEICKVAPVLGELLTTRILERAGAGEMVEGYGESVIAGVDGEAEHTPPLSTPCGLATTTALQPAPNPT